MILCPKAKTPIRVPICKINNSNVYAKILKLLYLVREKREKAITSIKKNGVKYDKLVFGLIFLIPTTLSSVGNGPDYKTA